MLGLACRVGETLRIRDDVAITVLAVKGQQVRIGIDAPQAVQTWRGELVD